MKPDAWLRKLCPGTLIAKTAQGSDPTPQGEIRLIIHCEVQCLPIGWTQLELLSFGPSGLRQMSIESNTFDRIWTTLTTCRSSEN